jgi:hypothetical protein
MKSSLRMRSFLILVGLHLYPGTYVPNIYRMSTRTVLSVLGYVAFPLLIQNYLCTSLPIIYTVVHKSFMYRFYYNFTNSYLYSCLSRITHLCHLCADIRALLNYTRYLGTFISFLRTPGCNNYSCFASLLVIVYLRIYDIYMYFVIHQFR